LPSERISFDQSIEWSRSFADFSPPQWRDLRESSWEAFVYFNYWDREYVRVHQLMRSAKAAGFPQRHLLFLEKRFARIFASDADPPPHIWKNAGITYQFLIPQGRSDLWPGLVKVWEEYLRRATEAQDPEIARMRELLQGFKARGVAAQ